MKYWLGRVMVWALLLGSIVAANAATCTSKASGNWGTASTWTCTTGTSPIAADTVVILSPHTVTLNSDYAATNLTVSAGAILRDNGKNLTLSGNAIINGTYDGSGNNGTLSMEGSAKTLSGTGTFIDIKRIEIDGDTTISAGANLNLTLDSEIRVGNNNAATLTIDGTVTGTAKSNGTRIIRLDNNNTSSVVVNGMLNAPGAFVEVQSGGTVANNGVVVLQYINSDGNNSDSVWTQGANSSLTLSQTPSGAWRGTFNASASNNAVTYTADVTPLSPSANTYFNIAHPRCAAVSSFTILGSSPCGSSVPTVVSINRVSSALTSANKSVAWTVTFSTSVTGVDSGDFFLVQTGGATGATMTSVTGAGASWTVTINTGTGQSGSVGLNLVDNDSIVAGATSLGGAGANNGNFSGQTYTLLASVCTGATDIIFCDDFERSNPGTVGNAWVVTPNNVTNCTGTTANTGCAGIDSDIAPFTTYANPRANPTRSMFTRWSIVSVDSPVINLAGRVGAQLSFWMRRGSDTFSEYPEAAGENYLLKYLASDNTWKILAQYPSGILQGQVFLPVIELPADALHAGFKMQFYQPSGSGKSGSGGAPGVVGYDYWHMDDVVVREVVVPRFTGAFCDNFEAGTGRWSITAEDAPAAASIGDASIGTLAFQSTSHALDMRWGYVSAATFKTDLTGVAGNITYWVKSGAGTRDPVNPQNLVVEYLNSSGVWTNLATYLGSAAAGTVYTASHPLPADAKHANFRLRFRQLAGSGYDKSYWHVDDACVGDLLATADLSLSKLGDTLVPGTNTNYTMTVTNLGPGTLSGSMEIVDTLPTGLSYLGGSGTGWSCGANGQTVTCGWTGTLVAGAVAPNLVISATVGSGVTGNVSNTAKVSGTVNDPVPGNNTSTYTSGNFVPGYVFTDKVCPSGVAIGSGASPCQLISWAAYVAGQDKSGLFITAVNSSGVPTALSASTATVIPFQFGLTCHNPSLTAGVQASFSAVATVLPTCTGGGAQPASWSAASSLSFPANSPSVATSYLFSYADVGEVELFLRNRDAINQMGASGRFVSKPAGFVLTEIKPTALPAGRCAVATTPAPALACANVASDAAIFVRAGEEFSVTVKALTTSGVAVPNFGKEAVPESVRLTPGNVVPGMVAAPALSGSFGAFASGVASGTTFVWNEVGIITLTPSVKSGDYLGAGNVIGTTTAHIGRFYPDHFDTVVTQVGGLPMACPGGLTCPANYNGMVYSGQPFSLTVTANSVSGSPTLNYNVTTGFSRTTALSAWGALGANTAVSGAGALGVTVVTAFVNGTLTEVAEKFTFSTSPTAPAQIYIRASDAEVSSMRATAPTTTSVEGGVTVLSGRLKILNVYGSERLPLPMTVTVQYFNGTRWTTSATDSVSTVSVGAVVKTVVKGPLTSGDMIATLAGDACAATVFCGGVKTIQFTNTAKAFGSANVSLSAPSYLLGGSNAAGINPSVPGLATFGIYKSPLIYRRENY